jgi:hypothetical protein
MRALLARFLIWLLSLLIPVKQEKVTTPVYIRAKALIGEAEGFAEGTSGEYKRHYVYAQLLKEFPEESRRNLGFLIEQVLQEAR